MPVSAVADRTDKIIHLRSLLRERFPTATTASYSYTSSDSTPPSAAAAISPDFPLGVSWLDALDDGRGLARGTLAEIVCRRRGGGAGTLIGALVQASATAARGYPLALIDGADSFDAASLSDSAAAAARLCRSLLWVRCRHRIDLAIKAADLLLRDGNLPVVLLDLQLCRIRELRQGVPGGASAWHRLRSLAEKTGTIFLTFTPEPIVPAAPWRLELDHRWTLDDIDHLPRTGNLRAEPVDFSVTRSRMTATTTTEADRALAG